MTEVTRSCSAHLVFRFSRAFVGSRRRADGARALMWEQEGVPSLIDWGLTWWLLRLDSNQQPSD